MTQASLTEQVKDCLAYFGPSMVRTIQEKLFLRGLEPSHLEVLNACEFLLNRKEIQEATGFHGRAFKVQAKGLK